MLARSCQDRGGHGEPAALDAAVARATELANRSMSPGWPADGSFFVSIAAYRDPDLLATIADGLAKARYPARLRFGICWQYGSELIGRPIRHRHRGMLTCLERVRSAGVCRWLRDEDVEPAKVTTAVLLRLLAACR